MDASLDQKIEKLRFLQEEHKRLGVAMVTAGQGVFYPFDYFMTAMLNRSMKLIDGFVVLIPDNFQCAAPVVRMQLDNFLRTGAARLVSKDVDGFAIDVLNGVPIKKMQHKTTKAKLTDSFLADFFDKHYPGLKDVYNKACGYVHLSETHFFQAISANDESGRISASISRKEQLIPDRLRIEATHTMCEFTKLLLGFTEEWTQIKAERVG